MYLLNKWMKISENLYFLRGNKSFGVTSIQVHEKDAPGWVLLSIGKCDGYAIKNVMEVRTGWILFPCCGGAGVCLCVFCKKDKTSMNVMWKKKGLDWLKY